MAFWNSIRSFFGKKEPDKKKKPREEKEALVYDVKRNSQVRSLSGTIMTEMM
jgi:hypothetical protein